MPIILNNEQDQITLTDQQLAMIEDVLAIYYEQHEIDPKAEVGLLLVDDAGIGEINRTYRAIAGPTDVLSFPMYEADEEILDEEEILLGDIVISLERTQAQSEEYGHSFERELMYLFVHGLLHLAGYDHMQEADQVLMRAEEERLLTLIGQRRA